MILNPTFVELLFEKMVEKKNRRIVIKIGSNIIARENFGLDLQNLSKITDVVANLHKEGDHVVIVSSGAIACGLELLGYVKRPRELALLQACASVGQGKLIENYSREFQRHSIQVGQVLLTREDFVSRRSYLCARRTLEKLLSIGVVPVINENDATAVEEIKFGDNDTLAALVAAMINTDYLFLLSDVEGFFRDPSDPSTLVSVIDEITPEIELKAKGTVSKYGSGGMQTKVQAARIATCSGAEVVILNGKKPYLILEFLAGKEVGTRFVARERIPGRKHWIAFALPPRGRIVIDEGASKALVERKKSLLPAGIKAIEGKFEAGDAVLITDERGNEIAKGISEYASNEAVKILGKKSAELKKMGFEGLPEEVVHRDKMVILEGISRKRGKEYGRC